MSVHSEQTDGSCTATTGGLDEPTGTLTQQVCQVGQNSDSGCTYKDNNANSNGEAFAAAGGGVYVCELAENGIRVWFITVRPCNNRADRSARVFHPP